MPRLSDWLTSVRAAFGPAAVVDARIRWFGKLPTYGDYIRSPNEPRWAREFTEDWLLKGFSEWDSTAQFRATQQLDAALGVVRLQKSDISVIFTLRDFGGDSTGTRRFPFCLFTAVDSKSISPEPATAWAGWSALLFRLKSLMKAVQRDSTPEWIASQMPVGEIAPTVDTDSALVAGLAWNPWFERVRPRLAQPMNDSAWLAALQTWGEQIRSHADEAYSLQLPLADQDWAEQAWGWLDWVAARVRVQPAKVCILIREGFSIAFLSRPVESLDFLLLTPADGELRYVDSALRLPVPIDSAPLTVHSDSTPWREALAATKPAFATLAT